MTRPGAFKIGDHVSWNSEAGRVSGIIRRKISAPIQFKGYTVHASREEPQYLIESGKTDPRAVADLRLSLDEFPELVGDPQIVLGPDLIATADQVRAARRCEQCTEGGATRARSGPS